MHPFSQDTEITWAVAQVDLSQRGTKGLQTFYLEASVPIYPHLQHRHFTVLGAWAAQAASVEGRRHHPKYRIFFFLIIMLMSRGIGEMDLALH